MTGQYLADLDELVLLCRSPEAKKYISEAVACYRAGAFRACIITTWIAVVFDFVDKLRELELSGDKKATAKITEFEQKRQLADIRGALEFERRILDIARDDFELLSQRAIHRHLGAVCNSGHDLSIGKGYSSAVHNAGSHQHRESAAAQLYDQRHLQSCAHSALAAREGH